MDEKVMAVVGAAAAVAAAGRGLRPLAKIVMRGIVAANDATAAGRRGLQELYAEAKAERAGSPVMREPAATTEASATPGTTG